MSIAQISPSSIMANPSHINPTVASEHQAALVTVDQLAEQNIKKSSTDTITISSYALKRASNSK